MSSNTRGEAIVDNGPCFLKTQKLALPVGRERRRKEGREEERETELKKKKKKENTVRRGRCIHITMIITSCSFRGTAERSPEKISVCNGTSSFLSTPVVSPFGKSSLPSALLFFRLSSFGHRARDRGYLDDRARESPHILI